MKNAEWVKFEHELRYLFYDTEKEPTIDDMCLIDDLKQSIIIFLAKSKFNENNIVLLENAKINFYNAINELKKRHKDIQVSNIENFSEKFLFSQQTTDYPTEKGSVQE